MCLIWVPEDYTPKASSNAISSFRKTFRILSRLKMVPCLHGKPVTGVGRMVQVKNIVMHSEKKAKSLISPGAYDPVPFGSPFGNKSVCTI